MRPPFFSLPSNCTGRLLRLFCIAVVLNCVAEAPTVLSKPALAVEVMSRSRKTPRFVREAENAPNRMQVARRFGHEARFERFRLKAAGERRGRNAAFSLGCFVPVGRRCGRWLASEGIFDVMQSARWRGRHLENTGFGSFEGSAPSWRRWRPGDGEEKART